jgi:hypothetical protein
MSVLFSTAWPNILLLTCAVLTLLPPIVDRRYMKGYGVRYSATAKRTGYFYILALVWLVVAVAVAHSHRNLSVYVVAATSLAYTGWQLLIRWRVRKANPIASSYSLSGMRYRRKFRAYQIVIPLGCALLLTSRYQPLWMTAFVFAMIGLWIYVEDFFYYWEICPDRLVEQRFYTRDVLPFTEITYVGPMTGIAAGHPRLRNYIEIQTIAGKKKIIQPADCDAFLAEMRNCLPQITLNR